MNRAPLAHLLDRVSRRLTYDARRSSDRWRRKEGRPHHRFEGIAVLADRHGFAASSLSASEYRVFSQNGEDGVIARIFEVIGVGEKFFVEFGVGDGTECNTRFLVDVLGWSGVYFEPNSSEYERLARRFANRNDVVTVNGFVTPENIDDQFAAAGVPPEPDLVSIDVDGQDYWIWDALEAFRPRVVIVEYNAGLPAERRLVEPRGRPLEIKATFSDRFGASIGALVALGKKKGYSLVHTELCGINAFFVRDDLAASLAAYTPLMRGPNYYLAGSGHPGDGSLDGYVEV